MQKKGNPAGGWKPWVCSAVLPLSLLTGRALLPKEEEALKPPLVKPVKENFEVYEVKRGSITKQVSGVGTLASDRLQYLYFSESGGRLASLNVSLGSEVKAGDVIAEIDTGDLASRIRQQEIALEKAQIVLEQTKDEKRGDAMAIRLKVLDVEKERIALEQLRQQAGEGEAGLKCRRHRDLYRSH
ncbi:efflux RND transporter periplasmic adaptor subunit [Paenibacillus sp. P25]|nr:efflux RND transporter periplasmic adaptor subunit [Paenibacillus sp. P25]